MKIINITYNYGLGGLEQVFMDYTKVLQKKGHKVFSIAPKNANFLPELKKIYKNDNYIFESRTIRKSYLRFLFTNFLKKFIQNIEPDIVISHGARTISSVKKACKNICPYVAVNHGGSVEKMISAEKIITVNTQTKRELVQKGTNEKDVFVIHNMIDIS